MDRNQSKPKRQDSSASFAGVNLAGSCNSGAFLLSPRRRGMMHVLLEKAIEILNTFVTQSRGNGAYLRRGIDAQQPLCEFETSLHLKLRHRHLVLVKKGSLQRPHLHSHFTCNGAQPQTDVAV